MLSIKALKAMARNLKKETIALSIAARDPRTPWQARALVGLTVAYVLSPIDLIPDFIPVLGMLDDLLIVPFCLRWAIRMVPEDAMNEARARAAEVSDKPQSLVGLVIVLAIWGLNAWFVWTVFRPHKH